MISPSEAVTGREGAIHSDESDSGARGSPAARERARRPRGWPRRGPGLKGGQYSVRRRNRFEAASDDLARLALVLPASFARLRLAPRRSLAARLMFRGRRGRRLIGPHLLLALAALSARTWRAL